jgi:predicted ester cyclase
MKHWHARDLDRYFGLYHPNAVLHHTHGDFDVPEARNDYLQLFEAMPDVTITFDHTLADGDLVAMNFSLAGTFYGTFSSRHGLSLLRFTDELCVERWTSSHDVISRRQGDGSWPVYRSHSHGP